jgi:GT2 family glycosyltransferase
LKQGKAHARTTTIDCTIVIPTRERHAKLERCLRSLAGLDLNGSAVEVLVSIDGPDTGEGDLVRRLGVELDGPLARTTRVIEGVKEGGGPGRARNRAIEQATGRLLLLLNDDVAAERDLVTQHLAAHADRTLPAMVLGDSPWVVSQTENQPDRLFDRLIRETSMVFFYDQMPPHAGPTDPQHDWGFRHAWTLNLSIPTMIARAGGGFCEDLPAAAFEDLEWAWRVQRGTGAPVLFRPSAVVHHEHRYEPADYLKREHRLGRDAWALAKANPACGRDLFGRDVRSAEEIEYSRAFVERERSTAMKLEAEFLGLADLPASAVDSHDVLKLVYSQHLLLKRWHWRRGLLAAAAADSEFAERAGGPVHAA